MHSRKQLIKFYLMGWRRGSIGLPKQVPDYHAKRWGYAARKAFFEGYDSGVRSRRSAESRARKEVGGSQS